MSTFYGVDLQSWPGQGLPDIDPLGKLVTGTDLLAQALINRLFCAAGSYLQSPDFGIDLASYLNAATAGINTSALGSQIEDELRKDTRVLAAKATVTFIQTKLKVVINIDQVNGPNFSLNLNQVGQNFNVIFEGQV
jgi:phage baseplate assembly protein W